MRKALDTKVKLQDKRLQDTKSKKKKEEDIERKKTLKSGKKLNLKSNVFKKPELAFKIPGIGVLSSVLTFFSFVLMGWMLKALPKIIKAIKEFMKRAEELIDLLQGFFNGIKTFFTAIFSSIELLAKQLGFGGADGLKPSDVDKTKRDINDAKDTLQGFINNFPQHLAKFIDGIGNLFVKSENTPNSANPRTPVMTGSLFDVISQGEGGVNSINMGVAGDTPGGAMSIMGKNLTDMTVDEIYANQYPRGKGMFAVGKYQIIPDTMPGFIAYLRRKGYDTSKTKFTENIQDLFKPYVINEKRPAIGRYLRGESNNRTEAAQEAAREFASVGLSYAEAGRVRGESRYSGTAGNAASISPEEIEAALDRDRLKGGAAVPLPDVARNPDIQRADSLAAGNGKKKIVVNETVPIDVSGIRQKEKAAAIAAASEIKIEMIAIDGTVTSSGGLFE